MGLPERLADLLSRKRIPRTEVAYYTMWLLSAKDCEQLRLKNEALEKSSLQMMVTQAYMEATGIWNCRGIIGASGHTALLYVTMLYLVGSKLAHDSFTHAELVEQDVILPPLQPGAGKTSERIKKWVELLQTKPNLQECIVKATKWKEGWIPERCAHLQVV